ncbi:MAG: GIY-YIG nuclease family protein [Desulfovibrio sp.]|nr:GIY-YIG nuclease family protein [Desulfovibrio sp.]
MSSSQNKHTTWFVYLVECADKTLYCGITTNLEHRLAQHNGLHPGGARYTRGRRPVVLVAQCACTDKKQALQREAATKKQTKKTKIAYLLAFTTSSADH